MSIRMMLIRIYLLALFASCGSNNVFDCSSPLSGVPCSERTKDEDARIALDSGDLETAITLLRELINEEPTIYSRYPLLAAALAGRSGFDIFGAASADFSAGRSLMESMSTLIPTPLTKGALYESSLTDMNDSIVILETVTVELRTTLTGDKFATSCSLQLMLYQSAYSIMIINKYTYSTTAFDPAGIASLSAEDATAILSHLLAAGSITLGTGKSGHSAAVQSAYTSIQSQPGSTDQEKIAAYVIANQ